MITDAATIQKLSLRSDLPRLKGDGFYPSLCSSPKSRPSPNRRSGSS